MTSMTQGELMTNRFNRAKVRVIIPLSDHPYFIYRIYREIRFDPGFYSVHQTCNSDRVILRMNKKQFIFLSNSKTKKI